MRDTAIDRKQLDMPFLTSEPISALAVQLLRRSIVLPAAVARVPAPEFAGPSGGAVKVRVPRPRTAHQQVTPGGDISFDSVTEDAVVVVLSHHYNAVLISDEDLSLSLENFGQQILLPAVASIAEAAEQSCADALLTAPMVPGIAWGAYPDAQDDIATVLAIRERLTDIKAPAANRYCVVSPDIATRLLAVPQFVQASLRGDQGVALDTATIGQVYGISFLESVTMPNGMAVAFHQSGCCFANVAPRAPGGVADSTVAQDSGLQLRVLLQFDPSKLSLAHVVSVFSGASLTADVGSVERAFLVDTVAS
jgi:hypothetical protein